MTKKGNNKKSGSTTLKKLSAKVSKISKEISTGVKYIYSPFALASGSVTATTPLIHLLNGVIPGDLITQRDGAKLTNKFLELNIQYIRASLITQIEQTMRVLVVSESTCLGSAISLSQLFNFSQPDPADVFNRTTRDDKRFKIHFDKIYTLGPRVVSTATTVVSNGQGVYNGVIRIKKKLNFVTNYTRGTGGTVSDIDVNSLYLIILTNSVVASDLQISTASQVHFTDM